MLHPFSLRLRVFTMLVGIARNYRAEQGEDKFKTLAKVVFDDADADKSGAIESDEVRTLLRRLGMLLSEEQAMDVLRHYDADSSGSLSESEWLGLVSDLVDGTFDGLVNGISNQAAPVGPAIALRKSSPSNAAKQPAAAALVVEELDSFGPGELARFLRSPGTAARLVEAIAAAQISGSALAAILTTANKGAESKVPTPEAATKATPAGGDASTADAKGDASEDSTADRSALMAQYEAWGRPTESDFNGWGGDGALSSWDNVGLDASGRVVKLGPINGVDLGTSALLPAMSELKEIASIEILAYSYEGLERSSRVCSLIPPRVYVPRGVGARWSGRSRRWRRARGL